MGARTDTRQRMIDAAKHGYRDHGVTSTGFTEVVTRAGAARGAIYHHFPGGKAELAVAVVESSGATVASLIDTLCRESPSPAEAVDSFVEVCAAALDGSGGRFGCPIAPAVLESPDAPAVLAAAADAFTRWRDAISARLLADGWDADGACQTATLVIAAVEGAFVLSRATRSAGPMRHVGLALRPLLARPAGVDPSP